MWTRDDSIIYHGRRIHEGSTGIFDVIAHRKIAGDFPALYQLRGDQELCTATDRSDDSPGKILHRKSHRYESISVRHHSAIP